MEFKFNEARMSIYVQSHLGICDHGVTSSTSDLESEAVVTSTDESDESS